MSVDDDLAVARLFLEKVGVSPQQLLDGDGPRRRLPTFAEFVPLVSEAVPEGTLNVYSTYWKKILAVWADRHMDEIEAMDVNWLVAHAKATAVVRRSGRGGHSAAEHAFEALRCLYRHAVRNRLMHRWDDPTELVRKPKRVRSTRRALDVGLVEQILEAASTTGRDPKLDALLLRLHIETACRRGGALTLRVRDLDAEQCLILLREKGNVHRWQPVSPTLMAHLRRHAQVRGAHDPESPALRYLNGRPLTARRYNHLWERIGQHTKPLGTPLRLRQLPSRRHRPHPGNNRLGLSGEAQVAKVSCALRRRTRPPHRRASPPPSATPTAQPTPAPCQASCWPLPGRPPSSPRTSWPNSSA